MADAFANHVPSTDGPATKCAEVAPNDSTDLADSARALYVAGAGDIELIPVGQSAAVTFTGVPAGSILPVRVARVLATGTTATGIVALS